jgi:hypothetical protein
MKKYILSAVAVLLMTAVVSAQTTKKPSTDKSVAKTSRPASKVTTSTTASVSPAAGTAAKTGTGTAIKRKHHHKKSKSVKTAGSK